MINPNPPMSLGDLQQSLPTDNRWDHLETMYVECTSMFGTLLPYPQIARQLEPSATPDERRELQRILRNIQSDSEKFLNELNNVRAQHTNEAGEARKGIIYDTLTGEDLFQYTGIASAYRSWMENFQALVMQPVEDFTRISEIIEKRVQTPAS